MTATVCPRLSSEVELRGAGAGADGLLAQHQRLRTQLPLSQHQEQVVRAMDGEHSLEELEAILLANPGTLAYRDLTLLLFQMWDRGLLENDEEVRTALFPHHHVRTLDRAVKWRGLRGILSASLMGTPLSNLLTGTKTLVLQALLTGAALVCIATGYAPWPNNIFRLNNEWVRPDQAGYELLTGSVLFYLFLVALLSLRGLVRASILASEGSGLRQLGLRQVIGIIHFDVDDREAYHLEPGLQVRFSLAGLLSITSVAGFLVATGLTGLAEWAQNLAAVALVLGFANLCPFFATDGARLVEQFSGLSRQRFRVRSYISKELVRGLVRPGPESSASKRFSVVATLWFLWFFGFVKLIVLLVFDHLTVLQSVVMRTDSLLVAVVCGLLLAYILALVLVVVVAMVGVLGRLLFQVFRRRDTDAPDGTQGVTALSEDERQRLLASIRQLSTGDSIPASTLDDVLSGVQQDQFASGSWILRAGTAAPRYYWVLAGRVELLRPLPEGEAALVASLAPGESFGAGLSGDGTSEYDVRASEETTVLTLDTASLHAVVSAGGEEAAGLRELLDRVSFLATVPELAALGPAGRLDLAGRASDWKVAAGEELVRQGDESDALYLVRSGRVKVVREVDGGEQLELAELGEGATFGEMGLLYKRPRTATVSSVVESHLIRVPRDVFEEVLKRSFHVGLALESLASSRQELQQ